MFHNFLKHYGDGKTEPFQEKPIEIKKLEPLMKSQLETIVNFMILAIQKKC